MKKTVYLLTTFILAATATGCASLSPAAEKLRIVRNPKDIQGCQPMAKVSSSSSTWGDAGALIIANHNSKVKLYNLAAEQGNTLLVIKDDSGLLGSDRAGIVFQCPAKPAPIALAPAPEAQLAQAPLTPNKPMAGLESKSPPEDSAPPVPALAPEYN